MEPCFQKKTGFLYRLKCASYFLITYTLLKISIKYYPKNPKSNIDFLVVDSGSSVAGSVSGGAPHT